MSVCEITRRSFWSVYSRDFKCRLGTQYLEEALSRQNGTMCSQNNPGLDTSSLISRVVARAFVSTTTAHGYEATGTMWRDKPPLGRRNLCHVSKSPIKVVFKRISDFPING